MADEYSFKYDGKSARTMNIALQGPIYLSGAVPRTEKTEILGRNGDLHMWDGSFGNRTAEARCFLLSGNLDRDITAVNAWLLGSQAYRRLVMEEDPNHFLLARAVNGVSRQARAGMLTPFTLEFDCKPQRYLNIGEREYDVTSSLSIFNPTGFHAKPILCVEGSGNVAVSFGDGSLSAVGLSGALYYDTETDKAYNGDISLDSTVFAKGNLSIPPGKTAISKYDQYAMDGGTYEKDVEVGDIFEITYAEAGLINSPSAVEIKGSGALDWYDDGGVLRFTAKSSGVGEIRIWDSDTLNKTVHYRVKSTGTITKITMIPRWWEL